MAKRIYIADDEEDIRNMEQVFLANAGYDVQTFPDGDSLIRAIRISLPDLLVLDIMMPGIDGLTLTNQIRQGLPTMQSDSKAARTSCQALPIIIVSARDTAVDRVTGLTMGCDDYLAKPFLPLELVARVKAIFRRQELLQPAVPESHPAEQETRFTCGNLTLDPAAHRIQIANAAAPTSDPSSPDAASASSDPDRQQNIIETTLSVTPLEFSFLEYLIRRKDNAVSKPELLENVWHYQDTHYFDGENKVTDDLVKRLRKKLKTAHSTAAIETIWGFGYRLSHIE